MPMEKGEITKKTIIISVLLLLSGCAQPVTYKIVNSDVIPRKKRSLDIILNRKVTHGELQLLALELKDKDSMKYERTFICYYLPGMTPGAGAWATTHFNPDLKIEIYGMTIEQKKKIINEPVDSLGEVMGIWFSDSTASKFTIYRRNNKLYMEEKYRDGSGGSMEIVEMRYAGKRRFEEKNGSHIGEYFLISQQGDLQIFDRDGLIVATATKIK